MIVRTVAGVGYAPQAELLDQLGPDVTAAMLRHWARTRGIQRVHVGREVWWPVEEVLEAEHAARNSGRGRPRRTD